MTLAVPDALASLAVWIVRQGLEGGDAEAFVGALGSRLAAVLPLRRLSIGVPSLDPNVRGASLIWSGESAVSVDISPYGAEGEALFRLSPIHYATTNDVQDKVWSLRDGEGVETHPILKRLAAEGMTQYALKLLGFPNEPQISGMALSVATDAPDGFEAAHHAFLDGLLPVIGLAVYRMALSRTSSEMLKIYVGTRTSGRILSGSVHRGEGEAINAAILFADLKGFTELSEAHPSRDVIEWLNRQFDALDGPIVAHGGEILKFMGDGLLAVFPIENGDGARQACGKALRAALEALATSRDLSRRNVLSGDPAMTLDVALHVGEVFYGNIGAMRRLDFTVIGSAVNRASRIEQLCDRLGRNLLLSKDFAERCGVDVTPLGRFALKGIAEPQEVYGYDDPPDIGSES